MNTTRKFARTLAEAFPADYADPIERPPKRMRFVDLVVICFAVVLALLAMAYKFGGPV